MASSVYAAPKYTGKVYTDQTITYYDISGLTSHTLRRQMEKNGPRSKALGARRYALTQWQIYPRVEYLDTPYGCEVGNVEIDLSIEYIYPNWVNRDNAHPQVIRRWDGFYRALLEYEEIHAQNGMEAARELAERLLHMFARRTCEGLENEVNSRIVQILQEYINYGNNLDRRTDHGKAKGVWLP